MSIRNKLDITDGSLPLYTFGIPEDIRKVFESTKARYYEIMKDINARAIKGDKVRDGNNSSIEVSKEIRSELKSLVHTLNAINQHFEQIKQSNVLKGSDRKHKNIGHGQDNVVYNLENTQYVYKECTRNAGADQLEYLRKKYLILKKYLGDTIPKSYFILSETLETHYEFKNLRNIFEIKHKVITLQRKIKGKDLGKMNDEEKSDGIFLSELHIAHKKYILLKMFLAKILKEMGMSVKDMDLKLDLGSLSDKDDIDIQNIDIPSINSPNIMWDGDKISFIDFDFGKWDDKKQVIYEKLTQKKVLREWQKILSIYNLG